MKEPDLRLVPVQHRSCGTLTTISRPVYQWYQTQAPFCGYSCLIQAFKPIPTSTNILSLSCGFFFFSLLFLSPFFLLDSSKQISNSVLQINFSCAIGKQERSPRAELRKHVSLTPALPASLIYLTGHNEFIHQLYPCRERKSN